jgi:hypothetical protein
MSRKQGSESIKALVNHWRWLKDQGPSYKRQAQSCKRQAASLTRQYYNDMYPIKYRRINNEN